MKIAIDLRSLSTGSISGVENYITNLLDAVLRLDKFNEYILFYNSWNQAHKPEFHYVNAKVVATKVPNKILNAALKLDAIKLEKIIGPFDCLFLPNLNQFSILPSTHLTLTVHDLSPVVTPEFYNFKRRLWHTFLNYKKAFERANVIFAVSEYTKLDIQRLFGIPSSKIKVAYPAVDPAVYKPTIKIEKLREVRNKYGLPGEYILFINTLEPRKNLSGLLDAFELLPDATPLVIVGRKGWKYKAIFKKIQQSKKRKNILYLGYVDNEADKAAIIKLSRMVVYPSFYEGFGFQPLEALATGVPVIASSITAIPEVVDDAGLLINPYQTSELAYAMQELLTNNVLRNTCISKGLVRAEKFRWESTAQQIITEFNNIF